MKRIKRIVATTGTYKDRDGNDKKQYTNIGTLFERPDGSQCIKLDAVPVGWDGWGNFYDIEQKQSAHNEAKANGYQRDELDSEIPF